MIRAAAIVLAAGRSTRYRATGGDAPTKLVVPFRGEPMLRHVVRAALASVARPVIVVTGHARAEVAAALAGESVRFAHNAAFASGLASSLRVGLETLGAEIDAAIVLLGDMPLVDAPTIDALIAAAAASPQAHAVVPVQEGERGNPVLLRRALFARAAGLTGDEGARRLLLDRAVPVVEFPCTAAVRRDIDDVSSFEGD